MADVFSKAKRSEVMSRIRGKGNKSTELAMAKAFKPAGIKGWRRHVAIKLKPKTLRKARASIEPKVLVVKPDFVFYKERVVVFVDGCFWHQCPLHSKVPTGNRKFWAQKLYGNVERDRIRTRKLKASGWRVLRFWEHQLDPVEPRILNQLAKQLARGRVTLQRLGS